MSSPLGGYYISARNRVRAKQEREKHRVKLALTVLFGEIQVFDDVLDLVIGDSFSITRAHCRLTVLPTDGQEALYQIVVSVTPDGGFVGQPLAGEQELKLAKGDKLSTLVAGNEQVRLTVEVLV